MDYLFFSLLLIIYYFVIYLAQTWATTMTRIIIVAMIVELLQPKPRPFHPFLLAAGAAARRVQTGALLEHIAAGSALSRAHLETAFVGAFEVREVGFHLGGGEQKLLGHAIGAALFPAQDKGQGLTQSGTHDSTGIRERIADAGSA
jgi:hypothetical protein